MFVLLNGVKNLQHFYVFRNNSPIIFPRLQYRMWCDLPSQTKFHNKDTEVQKMSVPQWKWVGISWMKPELSHCSHLPKQLNKLCLLVIMWVICEIHMITQYSINYLVCHIKTLYFSLFPLLLELIFDIKIQSPKFWV